MKGTMIIIFSDGTESQRNYTMCAPTLEELQAYLCGDVELIPRFTNFLHEGKRCTCVALCNMDGKRLNLPKNLVATNLWTRSSGLNYDVLCGPVLVCFGDREFMEASCVAHLYFRTEKFDA
jgi:hypothetical protein